MQERMHHEDRNTLRAMLAGQREAAISAAFITFSGQVLEVGIDHPDATDSLARAQKELMERNNWDSHLAVVDRLLEKVETDPRQQSLDSYRQWENELISAARGAGWHLTHGTVQDWIRLQGIRIKELEAELQARANQLGVACLKHDLTHALACDHCLSEVEARANRLEQEKAEEWTLRVQAEKRVLELASLNASLYDLEMQWDIHAVGEALGLGCGPDVRQAVLPSIQAFQARVKDLEDALSSFRGMRPPEPDEVYVCVPDPARANSGFIVKGLQAGIDALESRAAKVERERLCHLFTTNGY